MQFQAPRGFQFKAIALAVSTACACLAAQAGNAAAAHDKDGNPIQTVEISGKPSEAASSAKSGAPLRDLPLSISVVPAKLLQDQGALKLDDAIKNVSGLTQSSANNYGYFNNYLARGLQVNFLRNGLPDGPAVNGYARTVTDVMQVEVLKGPGSALYGSGAPGGFVNLVTRKPEMAQSQSIEAGIGSFSARHGKLDLTGPLAGAAAYRLIGAYSRADGYRGFGNKTIELLPTLSFKHSRDQITTVELRHFDSTIYNDSVGIPLRNHAILDVPQENRYYTPFSQGANKIDRVSIGHEAALADEWSVRANMAYGKRDLDFLRNVPNWRLNDPVTGTSIVNRNWRDQQDRLTDASAQLEAVWTGKTGTVGHEVLLGAAWSQTDGTAQRKQALLAPIANIFAPVFPEQSNATIEEALAWKRDVKSAQSGVYLQDQMAITDAFKVRAGLRYDRYRIDDHGDYNTLFDAGGAFKATLAPNGQSFAVKPAAMKTESASNTSHKVHPSLGAVYQPNQQTSFYAGASTGSFSNFNTEAGRTAFVPETSRQFEVGNKSTFLGGMVLTNVALYDTRRQDFFKTANGISGTLGSSQTRGLDAELTAKPLRGMQMRVSYAYQDALHTKYLDVVTGKDDPAVIGKRVPGTSHNQFSLWTSYDMQSAGLSGLGLGGGVSYRDDFYTDPLNTNRVSNQAVLELAVFYRKRAYELQANIGNVTNAKWYRYASGEGAAMPGDQRSLNVTARFKF